MTEYGKGGVLTSANDYVDMLLRNARNAFEAGERILPMKTKALSTPTNLELFSTFTKERWLDPALDDGPFVLLHGDLGMYNLIVNEKLEIQAVLDWEWSRIVPRQFFFPAGQPPPCLSTSSTRITFRN
jgi:hypothetical protein